MRYCWCPHHGQAAPSFSPRGRLTRLVTGRCQGSSLQYSNLKMKPRKFRVLLFLEVLYRKILPGKFISWDSKRQQILGNTKKWPNSLAKMVTVGLWQCSHDLQLHLGLLFLPISLSLAPHTSPCQVVCQLILIQTSVLARFREKREIIPSGSA